MKRKEPLLLASFDNPETDAQTTKWLITTTRLSSVDYAESIRHRLLMNLTDGDFQMLDSWLYETSESEQQPVGFLVAVVYQSKGRGIC